VPTYTYTCPDCGSFTLVRPIAQRSEPALCPHCAGEGRRTFSSPYLSRVDPALSSALTTAGTSSEAPPVTRYLPPAASPRRSRVRPGLPSLPRI